MCTATWRAYLDLDLNVITHAHYGFDACEAGQLVYRLQAQCPDVTMHNMIAV